MEDSQIIELFFRRSEDAFAETRRKYEAYCHTIVYGILRDAKDSEECINDACLRLWSSIPPVRPNNLKAYIGKIARNSALNAYEKKHAMKRGSDCIKVALEELAECLPDTSASGITENLELEECIGQFLRRLPKTERIKFLRRYWYLCRAAEIAASLGLKESKVNSMLLKTRSRFRRYLEKEGMIL